MKFCRNLFILFAAGAILMACNPRKKVKKYWYLYKDDPENTEVNRVPPDKKDEPEVKDEPRPDERDAMAGKVLDEAHSYLGTPYRYGGVNKKGIDCSGLVFNSYQKVGITLPRSSKEQARIGTEVKRSDVIPGDLVFFSNDKNSSIDHVGMVSEILEDDVIFIHASTSKGVRYDRMNTGYWADKFVKAVRVEMMSGLGMK